MNRNNANITSEGNKLTRRQEPGEANTVLHDEHIKVFFWATVQQELEANALRPLRDRAAGIAPVWSKWIGGHAELPQWKGRRAVMLNEAVALSLNVSPDCAADLTPDFDGLKEKSGFASALDYRLRLDEALAEFSRPERRGSSVAKLDPSALGVALSEFVTWAKTMGWSMPSELDSLLIADQEVASIANDLRVIRAMLIVLARDGITQEQVIPELKTGKFAKVRGLGETTVQKVFAAAARSVRWQDVGVKASTIHNITLALIEHMRLGGTNAVSPQDVQRLIVEVDQSLATLLGPLLSLPEA